MAKQGSPKRKFKVDAETFEHWSRAARLRGGIAAFLVRGDKPLDPKTGAPPISNMLLEIDDVGSGMQRVTMSDESGKPRIIFFVPTIDLAEAGAHSLSAGKAEPGA